MNSSLKWTSRSFLTAVLLLMAAMLQAQNNAAFSKISLGFVMGFPTGRTAKVYVNGYGGSFKAEYNILRSLNLTGSVGYLAFRYRDDVKKRLEYNQEETQPDGVVPINSGPNIILEEFTMQHWRSALQIPWTMGSPHPFPTARRSGFFCLFPRPMGQISGCVMKDGKVMARRFLFLVCVRPLQ